MTIKTAVAIIGPLLILSTSQVAQAQDAAETAIILGGSGPAQGKASRALGSAVAGSIGNAANAIGSTQTRSYRPNRRNARSHAPSMPIPDHVDPLQHTDAPTYRLQNGASIKVSGGLRPYAQTTCTSDCPVKTGQ